MASFLKKMLSATGLVRRNRLLDASTAIQRALKPLTTPVRPAAGAPAAPPSGSVDMAGAADAGAVPVQEKRAAASRGRFTASDFTGAGGTRRFKLFEPDGFNAKPLPLVVMLHGCTQNGDDFAVGTRMNLLAQQRGFFVLYPEQAPRSNAQKCWNWFAPGDQRRGAGEPALIAGLTRQVMQTHAVDPARVYVAGLSAGAAMAAILAREYPELYAAAGIHSGLPAGAAHDVASAFSTMRTGIAATPSSWSASLAQATAPRPGLAAWPSVLPMPAAAPAPQPSAGEHALASDGAPLIVFHGDADSTVNALNGVHAVEAALGTKAWVPDRATRPASGTARAFTRTVYRRADADTDSDATAPSRAEHWVIAGAGHAWSGGDPAGSYAEPGGPDASVEMLRFFAEHPLKARVEAQPSTL